MLGLFEAFTPKFVKKYANVAEIEIKAFKEYVDDVKKGRFPTDEHCYHILPETADEYQKMLDELRR
jgi:3-methyl-2-oxobutanoate hydroxymethyltransferase